MNNNEIKVDITLEDITVQAHSSLQKEETLTGLLETLIAVAGEAAEKWVARQEFKKEYTELSDGQKKVVEEILANAGEDIE